MADPRGGWREKVKINENSSSARAIEKLSGIPRPPIRTLVFDRGSVCAHASPPPLRARARALHGLRLAGGRIFFSPASILPSRCTWYLRFIPGFLYPPLSVLRSVSASFLAEPFVLPLCARRQAARTPHLNPPFSCSLDDVASTMPLVHALGSRVAVPACIISVLFHILHRIYFDKVLSFLNYIGLMFGIN